MNRKPLKVLELEKGIEIKNNKKDVLYTEKQFKALVRTSYIKIKTDKGLEYFKEI